MGAAARMKPSRVSPPVPSRTPTHTGRRWPYVFGAAGHPARPPAMGIDCHRLPRKVDKHGGSHRPKDLFGVPRAREHLVAAAPAITHSPEGVDHHRMEATSPMELQHVVYAGTGRGFVRMSASISRLGMCSGSICVSATFSRTKWYAMTMFFLFGKKTGSCMTEKALWCFAEHPHRRLRPRQDLDEERQPHSLLRGGSRRDVFRILRQVCDRLLGFTRPADFRPVQD